MNGILLVDKPGGMTSHDVVSRVRRAAGMREVGHAGTLDPMATGLLLVLLGEATKLSAWLTLDEKRYVTTVRFGATTATLDADGPITETSDAPLPTAEAVAAAVAALVGSMLQEPPAVSAIKVGGVAMHERVRRGETVALPPRPVTLHRATLLAVREGACDVDLTASKGFYVRSYARDLAASLGTLAYLTALRRLASGAFTVDEALDAATLERAAKKDPEAREALVAKLLPMTAAGRAMLMVTVDDDTAKALTQGKRPPTTVADGTVLVFDERAQAVCVATAGEGVLRVERGFVREP
jgi:tRNA pseudouridine55 synthase